MHEVALLAIPALAAPLYAIRAWAAGRRARRQGAIGIGGRLVQWDPLQDVGGRFWGPKDVADAKATALIFMSNRCPGVKAYDARLDALAQRYRDAGLRIIGVNSVPTSLYPRESLEGMREAAAQRGLRFPYVKDDHQDLKRRLGALVTPQAFLLDGNGVLRYRGRIDDAFNEDRATSHDLEDAIRAVLEGKAVARPQTHAIGCSMDEVPAQGLAATSSTRRPRHASA